MRWRTETAEESGAALVAVMFQVLSVEDPGSGKAAKLTRCRIPWWVQSEQGCFAKGAMLRSGRGGSEHDRTKKPRRLNQDT